MALLDFLPGVEFDRSTELLNTPDEELHPSLLAIKQQYQRGDFDEDGLLDRLTSQGFGLTNDVFHGSACSRSSPTRSSSPRSAPGRSRAW